MPSECQPNAYQDASQDGSQNAFKTPTELQSEKERLSFFGMVRGDARASPPGEGPEIATVGPQAVESVVAFTAKANNSRGKYPTEKRPVRDRWDQVNEVGEKPKIRASHLTREQINQSLAKQRA
jgi:hypothetical protein